MSGRGGFGPDKDWMVDSCGHGSHITDAFLKLVESLVRGVLHCSLLAHLVGSWLLCQWWKVLAPCQPLLKMNRNIIERYK